MKCTYSDKPVYWLGDDGGLKVGVHVLTERGYFITGRFGALPDTDDEDVLIAHSHTRELEFVEASKLNDYPSEPIGEPGK